jgi:hypothetical protein
MERQQFLVLHYREPKHCIVTAFCNDSMGRFNRQKGKFHTGCTTLEMSINDMSMIFGLVSLILKKRFGRCNT